MSRAAKANRLCWSTLGFGFAQGRLFGMLQVVEYQRETRSHAALTYEHSGTIGTWAPGELPSGQVLRPPPPSQSVRRRWHTGRRTSACGL